MLPNTILETKGPQHGKTSPSGPMPISVRASLHLNKVTSEYSSSVMFSPRPAGVIGDSTRTHVDQVFEALRLTEYWYLARAQEWYLRLSRCFLQ